MWNATTSHNKRYMLCRLSAARATKKPSRACALCGFFLRHIFTVAGTLLVPLSQPQKCHIPMNVMRHYFSVISSKKPKNLKKSMILVKKWTILCFYRLLTKGNSYDIR